MELIPVTILKIERTTLATLFLLGTKEKHFAIYTAPETGESLRREIKGGSPPLLYTHDLLSSICGWLHVTILKIILWDVDDTLYQARLLLEKQTESSRQILEIDARPSDCLILSIKEDVPLFCRRELLNKVLAIDAEEAEWQIK